jgi:hypothetical protein
VVYLRLGSTGVPPTRVTRLDDAVQYSSHVVNLVLPDFADSRLLWGSKDFEERRVARKFYEHFADTYDALAIVPQASHLANFGAFHANVKNDVDGIGLDPFDDSSTYGSGGRLHAIEVYAYDGLTDHSTSNHEISHQWGHYFDWERLGVVRSGTQPLSHAPLVYPGETLLESVLNGERRIRHRGDAEYDIERTPPPIRQHPIELYAMGLLSVQDLPPFVLFDQQDQLQEYGLFAPPGTRLSGPVRQVTANDLLGLHGPRRGPVPQVWRRATILVSRDRLASPEEMSYWNFVAHRLEDPGRSGVMSYDGHQSFDAATGWLVDLQTDIEPRSAPAIPAEGDVDAPLFGRRDCPGIEFAIGLPSRFTVRQEVRIEGRITATDQRFDHLTLRFWKYGGTTNSSVRFDEPLGASGNFALRTMFREGEEGSFMAELFLFWPDSGSQFARCTLTPVIVR